MHDMDHRLLSALRDCGSDARVAAAARGLSRAGEHAALWLAAGLAGAAVDRERRGTWLRATALTAAAHLASMGVKRVVRRPRPGGGTGAEPLVRTAGRHSFPSSHATSAAAATVAYGALSPLGARVVPPLAAAMCVSRMVVGVHYPSDVAAGAALGAVTARVGSAWMNGGRTHG
ncbi:membrane protein [Streptomyces longisporoflavus]|uniref:phosphatase PAP2 family protein n=1 Tax=Streptomyces longisporoflavus TaxID=28044 RepID=UPI00167D22E9|nr:phosphatase PAP2 family protein [Streptomyces longisporoflavus]GGV57927.1 membrane protein [Streptomyces longisporoflavus]